MADRTADDVHAANEGASVWLRQGRAHLRRFAAAGGDPDFIRCRTAILDCAEQLVAAGMDPVFVAAGITDLGADLSGYLAGRSGTVGTLLPLLVKVVNSGFARGVGAGVNDARAAPPADARPVPHQAEPGADNETRRVGMRAGEIWH